MRSLLGLLLLVAFLSGCGKSDSGFENERERVNAVLRNVTPAPQLRVEAPPAVKELNDPIYTDEAVNFVP
jgi:hypothetical protein